MAYTTPLPVPSAPAPPSQAREESPTRYIEPATAFALAEAAIAERRLHNRYTIATEVTFESETNFFEGMTENISDGGLFIATLATSPIGTTFDLVFELPDHAPPVRTRAVVRWLREGEDGDTPAPGMGVQFIDLKPEDALRIKWFTSQRDTLLYED